MDQQQRDATSTVLRLLRRLCAAAPGGAWKEEFIAFLWRVWSWLQACKNRNGAAPVPVADPRPLVGDDDDGYYTKVTEEEDDDFGKKERAIDIELTKNTNADLAGRAALGIDSMGKNADLAGPAALGIDFMGKNADLAGPAALGIDSKGENADLAGAAALGIDSKGTSADLAGAADLDINSIDKNADLAGAAALGIDSKGENADLAGPSALGIDSKGTSTDLAGAADLDISSIGKNADLAGPAAVTKDEAAGKNEPAPPARPVRRPRRARRRPAPATLVLDDLQEDESCLEPEVDECKSMHLRYVAACSSLRGKSIYCLPCFIKDEQDLVKLRNDIHKVLKHMNRFHKSNTYPYRCSKKGCYAMATNGQDIGHHEQYAHDGL